MKDRITHCFNRGAETYDAAAIVQTQVIEQLLPLLPSSSMQNILEIGCGTGMLSQRLLHLFPQSSYFLTDISSAMIEVCKKRFANHPHLEFACIDGENLPANRTYDLIVSSMTLHWFEDIETSFKKIITKLNPGGQFIFAMLGESSLVEWRNICEKLHFSIPTPSFPNAAHLQHAFPTMKMEKKVLLHPYKSLYDFLNSLKNLGATCTRKNHTLISLGNLRHALRHYNKEMPVTYEVILGRFEKK